jgi:surfactin synthase thioesterase subunit
MSEGVEVCPVQLPGRENRITEPPFTRLSLLVDAMAKNLDPYFDVPFAFFGHSIGAKIAFELVRDLRRKKGVEPVHLFVSGSRPPHIPEPRPLHLLPEHDFVRELRRFSGTPEAVMQSRDLMEMYLPILRADFSIDETLSPFRCSRETIFSSRVHSRFSWIQFLRFLHSTLDEKYLTG